MRTPLSLSLPLSPETALSLRAGDRLLLSGEMFTARDAAHKRLCALLSEGKPLPFPLPGAAIYYAGPAPAECGRPVGPIGPTTSYRMDAYAPTLLEAGLRVMIGKGERGPAVLEAMQRFGAVYLAAVGGAAALLARCVTACEVIAFEDLGAEAIRKLIVRDFPVIVAADAFGNTVSPPNML